MKNQLNLPGLNLENVKAVLQEQIGTIGHQRVKIRWVMVMAVFATLLISISLWLAIADKSGRRSAEKTEMEGRLAVERVAQIASSLQEVLDDDQTHALAVKALSDPSQLDALQQWVTARIVKIKQVHVFPHDLHLFDPIATGANGFALLDMMMAAAKGLNPPLQMHASLQPPMLVDLVAVKTGVEVAGFFVVEVDPGFVLSRFDLDMSESGFIRLSQYNGRQASTVLAQRGQLERSNNVPEKLQVAGTLFRIELPVVRHIELLGGSFLVIALILGLVMMAVAVFLFRKSKQWELEYAEKSEMKTRDKVAEQAARNRVSDEEASEVGEPASEPKFLERNETPDLPDPPPMRLQFDIAQRRQKKSEATEPVELTAGIFRAYDIRGVFGETLDEGVALQVGRVLGTLALEKNAGPLVVARDGRLSGPDLLDGMVEGITASGCNVLDIGAVPTGVLYYAAHELGAGSGVMITGSHNPPDYNGFKVMIDGDTLFGPQIRDIYLRIKDGNFQSGEGVVEQRDVLPQYRERIKGDIELKRPLRVVIDCGNGIGGVCAADVLRDIGADVLPLFDEVDGTFPNHHPDPSDPDNLQDLIESVRLMDADIGLALDGDADRLGVVTSGGAIIYSDRVMMLLAMDVLDRVPGATIIYDVKCTGHLAKVIEQAGGKAVMYKTGHSLIKAKMKEIGSPFAGEMSGHFFFAERWYGVDDGIYAAARLLEILAGAEAPPEAILNALPTSFSTPELKVQMREGENHAFIESFQSQARFDDARVSTIDGVRADYSDGWGLVRASNTTPIVVARFDAESEIALERIKNTFRARMLAVNPDLELPF